MFYVYIILKSNGAYYVGQTNSLEARLQRHQTGQVLSTKGYRPLKLVYSETYPIRSDAVKRAKGLEESRSS